MNDPISTVNVQDGACRLRLRPGYTLLEALLVLAIMGIVAGMTATSFRELANEFDSAVSETSAYMRLTRHRAIAKTSAYRVVLVSQNQLRAEYANTCESDVWTVDDQALLFLEGRTTLEVQDVLPNQAFVCFSSRGVASASSTLVLRDPRGRYAELEIFVGGGVKTNR